MKTKSIYHDRFSLRALLWVMLLSLTIIFAAIVSSYLRYSKTLNDYQLLNHTAVVMKEVMELKSEVYETESSIRAFLIAGELEGQPDLNMNFKYAEEQWGVVKQSTKDNPEQQALCDTLIELLRERYIVFSASITGRNANNDSIVIMGVFEGTRIMGRFTQTIDRMMMNEYQLNAIRADNTEAGTRYTPVFLLLASAISTFFIILVYMLLVREYRKSITLQKKLSANVKELNQSNKELEQFAYVASHDLQEPLRKLRSFSSILNVKEDKLSEESKGILKKIDGSATRMQTLIDDLLTFSRMLAKPPETEKVNLDEVIGKVKAELYTEQGRTIIVENNGLPEVNGYSNSLYRLFQNLFSNSIKYAKAEGDIKITLNYTTVKGDTIPKAMDADLRRSFYNISVTDNGIGFENEYAEKIFTIFQRLHNKNEYSGTGIGLAICKRVVENHEGYIVADGKPGVGTTMHIYLPAG